MRNSHSRLESWKMLLADLCNMDNVDKEDMVVKYNVDKEDNMDNVEKVD